MTALIICTSKSNGSTMRVADELASVLGARVVSPETVTDSDIERADLVGWGSGIYWMSFAPELVARVEALSERDRGRAFVFATSGMPETPLRRYTANMRALLASRGFSVADDVFHCRGLDTMGPLGWIGGVNKGHPSETDLAAAREYARRLA
ncbi:flavodoxin domain-containing protein [Gordonia malaquae]|jgi:flavodoxin|uniref:flavodoxin domain-containing protein n=1 Tax=Gordonia malaquae TaxID=410332 RepID=UPI0030C7943E